MSALGGHAAHWGEDFNSKRQDNEDIRKEVMAMARKVKGEKDAKKLTRMAEKLKHIIIMHEESVGGQPQQHGAAHKGDQ